MSSTTIKGLVVTLKAQITADQAKRLCQAIELLNGVISVRLEPESLVEDMFIREQVRHEFREKLIDAFFTKEAK